MGLNYIIQGYMLLQGKTAVITGTARGIGKATAELFAANGAELFVCARTQTDEYMAWAEELAEKNNVKVTPVFFDLSDSSAVDTGIKSIIKANKNINILVNNAAVSYGTALSMMPVQKIRELFEVNYFAQLQIIQLISKVMTRNKQGSIINIASVSGMEAYPGNLAYGSSKAALIYATKVLSKELAPFGIRVNAVAPGTVKTDMEHTRTPEQLEEVINRAALKRMAQPSEIADAVCYLAGDASSYITGQVMIVDGGRMNV